MLKTVEELKAAQAKELAKLEAQHRIAAKLPEGVEAWYIEPMSALKCPHISIRVDGIAGAVEVLEKFTIVPMGIERKSCTRVAPRALLKDKQVATPYDVNLCVDQIAGSTSPGAKVACYIQLPEIGVVSVTLDVRGPGYIGSYPGMSARYDMRGRRVLRDTIRPNLALYAASDEVIKWAAGDNAIDYSYLFEDFEDLQHADL